MCISEIENDKFSAVTMTEQNKEDKEWIPGLSWKPALSQVLKNVLRKPEKVWARAQNQRLSPSPKFRVWKK